MTNFKKTTTVVMLAAITILATAATITPAKKFKNLKVLPQDISEHMLDSIMDTYNKALKVSCDFCHTAPISFTGIKSEELDFSLDNEMKENARRMMRLTIDINKQYFYFDKTVKPEYLNVITCNTCHRGNPYPANE